MAMEPIFTLPYSEFEAISIVNKIFQKKGFAMLVPTSRQQAGIDFVVMKAGTRRVLRVQVKSSRSYVKARSSTVHFWFSNFAKKYRRGVADVFLLLGVYPAYSPTQPVSHGAWKTILLALRDREMENLLAKLKTKGGKDDRFFGFGFDRPAKGAPLAIVGNRGAMKGADFSRFLLDRRRDQIARMLGT